MGSIQIEISHPGFPVEWKENLESNVRKVVDSLIPTWLEFWELSLLITTDKEIQMINLNRRGKDKPTDVLSFPILNHNQPLPIQILGEVILSWDRVLEQSKIIGHSEEEEFYRLLVHGILHLFGYDHETSKEDEELMKSKENELLELILGKGDWH